ncbi:uncharacterized protein [Euphorbia lathyris]|uniref:uncharacterized protein isoform X2 n=1 Tax=Euphorbia lathyris TaxID=212925 RepID=UPI0033141E89
MDDLKARLKQVFGESSDSEDDKQQLTNNDQICRNKSFLTIDHNPIWEPIKEINGLWLCREFLSPPQQSILLSAIQNEGWFTEKSINQAMRFGDLPSWATELSNSIREAVLFSHQSDESSDQCVLPSDLVWREPLFDQLIVNSYGPGDMCTC